MKAFPMLEVAAAREVVLQHARRLPSVVMPLASLPLNQVIAADVPADLDSPPFAKAMMDGYAVRSADCCAADTELSVAFEVRAGGMPTAVVRPGEAARIFTGAPMPDGADAVVKQEDTTAPTAGRVRIPKPVAAGLNALPRGQEMRRGDVVLPAGTVVTPAAVGLLAAVGCTRVNVVPRPRAAVLATGDELVDAGELPTGGQIRNTNGPMLAALAARAGADVRTLGIARDDRPALDALIRDGLNADVLLLCGGVSVGKYDLVPDALKAAGVAVHFHTVRMKPGKPLLFGTAGSTLVFGLPGNPVSAFVAFELFVRPALAVLGGRGVEAFREVPLPLAAPLTANHDRPTYQPAIVDHRAEPRSVRPLPWGGSADLRGLLAANALVVLPPGPLSLPAGARVPVLLTD